MDVSEDKRLKMLEDENTKLKRLLANAMLDNAALKDILEKRSGDARSQAESCCASDESPPDERTAACKAMGFCRTPVPKKNAQWRKRDAHLVTESCPIDAQAGAMTTKIITTFRPQLANTSRVAQPPTPQHDKGSSSLNDSAPQPAVIAQNATTQSRWSELKTG